jgi:hypothetical protein
MVTIKREMKAKDYQTYPRKCKRDGDVPKAPPYHCDYCMGKIQFDDSMFVVNKYYLACLRCGANIKDTSQHRDE